jgi:hypothetical protein
MCRAPEDVLMITIKFQFSGQDYNMVLQILRSISRKRALQIRTRNELF